MTANMQVEVRESSIPGAGRGLFAMKDFRPGDAVVIVERPYVAELYNERVKDTCAWCLQRDTPVSSKGDQYAEPSLSVVKTKACGACQQARYCSKPCQTKAWKKEHKYECKTLQKVPTENISHGIRTVMKLLLLLKADPDGLGRSMLDTILQLSVEEYHATFGAKEGYTAQDFETQKARALAMGGIKEDNPQDSNMKEFYAALAWHYAGMLGMECKHLPEMNTIVVAIALYTKITQNFFDLRVPYDEERLAFGWDPIMCAVNHSCDPNATTMFTQPGHLLRAMKAIKKGEEISTEYTNISYPRGVRQEDLSLRFHFTCKCSLCVRGSTTPRDAFLRPAEDLPVELGTLADGVIAQLGQEISVYLPQGASTSNVALSRVAAIEAVAFHYVRNDRKQKRNTSDADLIDTPASETQLIYSISLCIKTGMWTYSRQPVPRLLEQLERHYMETNQLYLAWLVGLKHYFAFSCLFPPWHHFRMSAVWRLVLLSRALSYPPEVEQPLKRAGVNPLTACWAFLLEIRDNLPKPLGHASRFGKIVDAYHDTLMAMLPTETEASLRFKVKVQWVILEDLSK